EGLADHRCGHLLVGDFAQVHGGEVGAALDAGIVAQRSRAAQGAAGGDIGVDGDVVGDDDDVLATAVGGRARAPGQQGGLGIGIEEGDLVAGDAVVHAQAQQGAVAPVDLQVGGRQAAADEGQVRGEGNAGHHVVGTSATAVLDGRGQAQQVTAIDP